MYLALYRKYRPSTFDDVISQEHITTTLKNQIATGQIAHAYLFTGTRGTGKTSCAKIMAKAVNCLSPEKGSPCGKCAACKAIEEGSTDIIEIDAASNNGVDNIRQIRDEIIYAPIDCKYKVYIIDEVHMLSAGAFNALLKTLEEPPPHVIFILATTEYYKIPATILSRCQQLLFSKIDADESAKRLLEIAEKEKITLEPAAAQFIARLADGAMRDALSLLDQCISVSDRIDEELVRQCSGTADSEYLFAVSQAALDKSPADALGILDKLIFQGKDISRFIEELTTHYRNLMLEKTAAEELIKASENELEQYRKQCRVYSLDEIMYHIDLISDSLDNINRMKQTGQARLLAEQLLIRLTAPRLTNDASALAARIGSLESKVERLAEAGAAVVREERAEENKAIPPKPKTEEKAEKAPSEAIEEQESPSAKNNGTDDPPPEKISGPAPEAHEAEGLPGEFYTHSSEKITAQILPVYDDIPLPAPPPEEAFEGGYGNDAEPEEPVFAAGEKAENITESRSENKSEKNSKKSEAKKPSEEPGTARPVPESDLELPNAANPLPQWQEIISGLAARSRGLMKSSQAYLYDGKIYISSTASSEKVLKDGAKAEELRKRAKEVLGGEMEMFILKAPPPAEKSDVDIITPFLQKAESLGIKVSIK
ncbi:MAG: DNA polymerase III subunit gamma/tau [Ruminiclostridium sp.]|nr:DNA polymerase III subunit gamma/tau [Ruminiclostridium sp.]